MSSKREELEAQAASYGIDVYPAEDGGVDVYDATMDVNIHVAPDGDVEGALETAIERSDRVWGKS